MRQFVRLLWILLVLAAAAGLGVETAKAQCSQYAWGTSSVPCLCEVLGPCAGGWKDCANILCCTPGPGCICASGSQSGLECNWFGCDYVGSACRSCGLWYNCE